MEEKNWFNNPVMSILVGVFLLCLIIFVGFSTFNAYKEGQSIGIAPEERNSVTITGEGRVDATPDVGQVTVTIVTENENAETAQNENVEQFNRVVAALKALGIEEKDLKTTSYNVYPRYDYENGTRTQRGFEVNQSLEVKIRDLDKSGDIIRVASANGVNQVSGLSFVVDEPEQYREEARRLALENAKEKADELSEVLGVELGKIISFSESASGAVTPTPLYREVAMMDEGLGVGGASPQFEEGSEEIVIYATIVYEVK